MWIGVDSGCEHLQQLPQCKYATLPTAPSPNKVLIEIIGEDVAARCLELSNAGSDHARKKNVRLKSLAKATSRIGGLGQVGLFLVGSR